MPEDSVPDRDGAAPIVDMGLDSAVGVAAETLLGGGIVAFPTDTVYALAASLAHPPAVARLFQIKRRPAHKPIPILLAATSDLAKIAQEVDPATAQFVTTFWPGQLTVILPARVEMPDAVTGRDELDERTVAVRVPDHARARLLIALAGGAIAATSANTSGHPPALTANEVSAQLGSGVDLILDGGRSPGGVASTIVAIGLAGLQVLRQGSVTAHDVETVWHSIMYESRLPDGPMVPASSSTNS